MSNDPFDDTVEVSYINEVHQQLMECPVPEATASYTPIAHRSVHDAVLEAAGESGLQVTNQEFKSSRKGEIGIGMYSFRWAPEHDNAPMNFRMAWGNSYDKSRRLRTATGLYILACENGAFWGDLGMTGRLHTGRAEQDMHMLIRRELSKARAKLDEGMGFHRTWEAEELTARQRQAMLGELTYGDKLISHGMITPLLEDSEEGPHAVRMDGSQTRWGLYMNLTHAVKNIHPHDYMQRHVQLHERLRYLRA